MKGPRLIRSWHQLSGDLRIVGGIAATACTLLGAVPTHAETSFSGRSDTLLRIRESLGNKTDLRLYEYLQLSTVTGNKDGSATSLHIGGWGRVGEQQTYRDEDAEGDLQYGYISYQGAKNNMAINAGRQFVVEGVAAQRLDGLYVRNDFANGFAAAAFVGSPVNTDQSELEGDDFIYGGRISQGDNKHYSLGVSALKSFADGDRYREEEGVDIWLHPTNKLDITGRSNYNSLTSGWMEHNYAASYIPRDDLSLSVDIAKINYEDYFYRVTTSALSLRHGVLGTLDPKEKSLALGASAVYSPSKQVTVTADYRNYDYEIEESAQYYGGKIAYSAPQSFAAGISLHRMDGNASKLQYYETRIYASKKLGQTDVYADLINLRYDNRINDVKNSLSVSGGASCEISECLKVGANLDYSKNPYYDDEVQGLVKLTYIFDSKGAAEGREK